MPAPTRQQPYASVKLFDVGQGDPICTYRGMGWYDALGKAGAGRAGTFELAATGRPKLEILEGIGLTCRPVLTPQDTRLSQWTGSGGQWEELRNTTGGDRRFRLSQFDSGVGVQYSRTCSWSHLADPHLAFSVEIPPPVSDWDFSNANLTPYFRIELGGGAWGLQWSQAGTFLVQKVAGVWQPVVSLSGGTGGQLNGSNEQWVYLRCLRGKIGISFDFGTTYTWYPGQGAAVSIPAGAITIRGQGGEVRFGVHQLAYATGYYESEARNTFVPLFASTPTLTARKGEPTGTTVALADRSNLPAKQAKYRATLTPASTPAVPFAQFTAPYLAGTVYQIPAVVQTTGDSGSTPWDQWLLDVDTDFPREPDGAQCTLTFHQSAQAAISLDELRDRRVEVTAGYRLSDGTNETYRLFVGYVESVEPDWGEVWGQKVVRVVLRSPLIRFGIAEWTPLDVVPLGGLTPNGAADYILATEGLNASYRNWHINGALLPLDPGTHEDPFELIKPREKKLETLRRIFGYADLELLAAGDGTYYTLPRHNSDGTLYAEPTVTWHFRSTPQGSTDDREQFRNLRHAVSFAESATAALVWCTDPDGNLAMMVATDDQAETNLASGRFTPFRRLVQEELTGSPTAAMAVGRCQSLAMEHFPLKREPTLEIPVHPNLRRRQRVDLTGAAGMGIPDGTTFAIMGLRHHYQARKGLTSLTTTVTLERIAF